MITGIIIYLLIGVLITEFQVREVMHYQSPINLPLYYLLTVLCWGPIMLLTFINLLRRK